MQDPIARGVAVLGERCLSCCRAALRGVLLGRRPLLVVFHFFAGTPLLVVFRLLYFLCSMGCLCAHARRRFMRA